MNYLRDKQYYIDLYDLHTIEECLDYYRAIKDGFEKERKQPKLKKFSKEDFDKDVHKATSFIVNAIKGERYRHKAESISKWMDRDRSMQEKYDEAIAPAGIICEACQSPTRVSSKDLMNSYQEDAYVLFMFACVKCNKHQALYEDGTEWKYEPEQCPKCKSPLKSKMSRRKNEVLVFTYSCTNCSYTKEDVDDLRESRKKREEEEARDKKLLAEYRKDFVYTDEAGRKHIAHIDQLKAFMDEDKKQKIKDKDPIYQKARQLKKLTVTELENLLSKSLEKEKYVNLSFDKPEIDRYVIIPFTVQEVDKKRNERDSENMVRKVIKQTLEKTNWRLMTEGLTYRLGYLSGRLKGHEREDDLVNLVTKNI